MMDVDATNSAIQNNIIMLSPKSGLKIWGLGEGKSESDFYANSNVISHNLFYGNHIDGLVGKNPFFGDPRFINAATAAGVVGNFQLQSGSPAIDAGMDAGLPKFNNTPQDLGAFEFGLPQREQVTLKVFDALGREVAKLLDGKINSGEHSVVFDAKGLASGVYFYRLQAGQYFLQKSMEAIK